MVTRNTSPAADAPALSTSARPDRTTTLETMQLGETAIRRITVYDANGAIERIDTGAFERLALSIEDRGVEHCFAVRS